MILPSVCMKLISTPTGETRSPCGSVSLVTGFRDTHSHPVTHHHITSCDRLQLVSRQAVRMTMSHTLHSLTPPLLQYPYAAPAITCKPTAHLQHRPHHQQQQRPRAGSLGFAGSSHSSPGYRDLGDAFAKESDRHHTIEHGRCQYAFARAPSPRTKQVPAC